MTDSQLLAKINNAMETHVYRPIWQRLSQDSQNAFMHYALEDIQLEVPWVTQETLTVPSLEFSALLEQLAFLARNAHNIRRGKEEKTIVSESVEGLSVSYAVKSNVSTDPKTSRYSLRALAFIERIKRAKLGHSLRVYRG